MEEEKFQKDLIFTQCLKKNNVYIFSFFFRYRIDHMSVILSLDKTQVVLHDKGAFYEQDKLSEQQDKVIQILENNPEKVYLLYHNKVL